MTNTNWEEKFNERFPKMSFQADCSKHIDRYEAESFIKETILSERADERREVGEKYELLQRVRDIMPDHSMMRATTAIYISPAQQLRNSADRIEYEERTMAEFDEFLLALKKTKEK